MLEFFTRPGSRLSFQNVCIAQNSGEALRLLLGYAGADSEALDEPFRKHLRGRNLPSDFLSEGLPDGYLDTLAVTEAARGQGVGARLLREAAIQASANGLERVDLLVERANRAARLYRRGSFGTEGKRTLGSHVYDHMVRQPGAAPQ